MKDEDSWIQHYVSFLRAGLFGVLVIHDGVTRGLFLVPGCDVGDWVGCQGWAADDSAIPFSLHMGCRRSDLAGYGEFGSNGNIVMMLGYCVVAYCVVM